MKHGIKSSRPAAKWEDGMLSGNGTMGIVVMGEPVEERIIVCHERMYEPQTPEIVQNKDMSGYLPELRKLLLAGKYRDAAAFMSEKSGHGLVGSESFHPAFAMVFVRDAAGQVRDYGRATDFQTGEVSVRWKDDAGSHLRRAFVSRADGVMVWSLQGDEVKGTLRVVEQGVKRSVASVTIEIDGQWQVFKCMYTYRGAGYIGVVRVCAGEGRYGADGKITRTGRAMALAKVERLDDYGKAGEVEARMKTELAAIEADYDRLLARHAAIHGAMFRRVSLELAAASHEQEDTGEPPVLREDTGKMPVPREDTGKIAVQREERTSEELIAANGRGNVTPALLQKMFEMGRYVLISSCGQLPPNLVGLWTGKWRCEWGGSYTLDANLNLAISSGNIGNLPECMESYFRFVEALVPDWRENARLLYGCRGILSCLSTTGRSGIHNHFNTDWPLAMWTGGAAWLLSPYWEYWQVFGDDEFLRVRLLPLMKELALFYEDFLTIEDDGSISGQKGRFVFAPAYSPENTPSGQAEGQTSQASVNATMDIAAAKELLANLIEACQRLGVEKDGVPKWRAMLAKMPDYMVNEDGAIKEWVHKSLGENYDHRHESHLYPAWPGFEISAETPELLAAARKALELRRPANYSAHGFMHKALIAARLKMPQMVRDSLAEILGHDFIYAGGATSHYPGRVYNMDACTSLPTVVMEMLVFSRPGVIELLPALPEELGMGCLRGVLCRGGVTIEELSWDMPAGKVRASLRSKNEQEVTVMALGRGQKMRLPASQSTVFEVHSGNG